MKHKVSKRSSSNKQPPHRSYPTQTRRLSIQIDPTRVISANQIDLGTGTVHLDSYTPCLKPNLPLKSQKVLKRDLLRCSNQRPSLLGPQTLQPSRIHPSSQQTHSIISSSSTSSSSFDRHRRSLSVQSQTPSTTIDRIGPWPDVSISRLHSDGNDLLRPLKNFRNIKNPRLFSPKYYAGLSDNTNKFQFHSSKRNYIEEYRKQKGYLLIPRSTQQQVTSLSFSSSKLTDDDQSSARGTFSGGAGNCIPSERSELSMTNLSLSTKERTKSADELLDKNHFPIISSITNQINIFPHLPNRNSTNHLRSIRHNQHYPAITLPALPPSSLRYLDSVKSIEKVYRQNKKTLETNQSKLVFIHGRQKKSSSSGLSKESEITSSSQDHSELRNTSSAIEPLTKEPTVVIVYQISRPTQLLATQNEIESLS